MMDTLDPQSSENRSKPIKIDDFLVGMYEYVCFAARLSHLTIQKLFERIDLARFFEAVDENLEGHPVLKFAVFGAAACVAVPVILFTAFAIASVVLTFIGFVLLEGILLGIGGFCFCAFLLSIIMVVSILAVLLELCYIAALKLKLF